MPNSLRSKLSKLRYKGEITQEEYSELIKKLDGHDAEIKGQIIREVLETVKEQNEIYLAEREKQIRAEAVKDTELFREIFLDKLKQQSVDMEESLMYKDICTMAWNEFERLKGAENES